MPDVIERPALRSLAQRNALVEANVGLCWLAVRRLNPPCSCDPHDLAAIAGGLSAAEPARQALARLRRRAPWLERFL